MHQEGWKDLVQFDCSCHDINYSFQALFHEYNLLIVLIHV
jgi:hypothetical protein